MIKLQDGEIQPQPDKRRPARDALEAEQSRVREVYARRGSPARDSLLHPGQLFMVQDQVRRMLAMLTRERVDVTAADILEVGCGSGRWLREFIQWGADPARVHGVDVLPDKIEQARLRCPTAVDLQTVNGAELPFADASFDLMLQSTVFTSILDTGVRHRVAAEMRRVLRPSGLILWYDFSVPHRANPDVRAVTRAELRTLFPGCSIRVGRVTLAPPIARAVAPRSWVCCTALNGLPFLRTHLLAAIRVDRAAVS
jgi:SAM-dependent methyltransferase